MFKIFLLSSRENRFVINVKLNNNIINCIGTNYKLHLLTK